MSWSPSHGVALPSPTADGGDGADGDPGDDFEIGELGDLADMLALNATKSSSDDEWLPGDSDDQ